MRELFRGSFAALPTPFADGALDEGALVGLVEHHADAGTRGLVPTGTTGEAATLDETELRRVIELVVAHSGELLVVPGVGTNATRSTVERARVAEGLGADAVLVVTPFYNCPSQEGLFRHFAAVAEAVRIPLVLYNVPSRTGVDLLPATVARLADSYENVVAIKQASRSLVRVRELVDLDRVAVLGGEDARLFDFLRTGATGLIGVLPNLAPRRVARLIELMRASESEARALMEELLPLAEALFVEVNPVPLKAALARMGRCREDVRLPLAPLAPESRAELERVLAASGLLAPPSVPAGSA